MKLNYVRIMRMYHLNSITSMILIVCTLIPAIHSARDRVAAAMRHRPAYVSFPSSSSLPMASALTSNSGNRIRSGSPPSPSSLSSSGTGISSTDAGIVFPKNQLIPGSSLEAKLVSLANVTKAEDFFRILGVSVPSNIVSGRSGSGSPDPDEPIPLDRTRQRPARQSFMHQAACEPEMRTIDLSEYTHTSVDPDVAVFPRCIRVPRCGGCCGPSDLLQCLPTRVTIKEIPRVLQRLTVASKDSKNTIQETVQVEYHESCACQCRIQEKDCDPSKHQYHPDKCKCMCVNTKDQSECMADPEKEWHPADCACKCRSTKRCSTGLKFSHETCACEIEQSK